MMSGSLSILPKLWFLCQLLYDRPYPGTYMLYLAVLLPAFDDFPGIKAASGNKRGLEKGSFAAWHFVLRFGLSFVPSAVLQI